MTGLYVLPETGAESKNYEHGNVDRAGTQSRRYKNDDRASGNRWLSTDSIGPPRIEDRT